MLKSGYLVLGLFTLWLAGCSDSGGPPRKAVYRVSGTISVDGQPPGSPVQVQCHDLVGTDSEMPTYSQAITDGTGKFAISTYESGDGMPPGQYALTFTWKEFDAFSNSFGGADRLNNRYSDPLTSEVRVTVSDGPVDLGTIELTTGSN